MKRVLNSGSINLPYFKGSEKEITDQLNHNWGLEKIVDSVCRIYPEYLRKMEFKFEIKAPLLTYQAFQDAHLGTLTAQEVSNHLEWYVPAQFYKQDPLEFVPMSSKECNDLNTKLNNFYHWSFNFYNKITENGLCKEQARLMLPQGMFITFIWDVNAKDLIKFIEEAYGESPEMFGYCSTFVLYLEEHLPLITKWLKQNKWKDISL